MEQPLQPTLPVSWYVDHDQFIKEKNNIFQQDWIFLCHAGEVPDNLDYITGDVAGIPVAVLRDEHGKIQVLLNICRHRGALLLTEKRGKLAKPTLMCQYHGWCYHADGSFKQAPFLNDAAVSLDLKKIHWQEIRGLIFVSFSQHPVAFDERKKQILHEIESAQFKIDDYRYRTQIVREGNFNWKVWVEGFQECYHCPTIHAGFNRDFNLAKYEVKNKDHFSVHSCPRKHPSTTGSFEGLWMWLYPNCGLPCYEKVYYSLRINPKAVDRTELIYTFFTNDLFKDEDEPQFFGFIKQITDEDIAICEQVQKNLASGVNEHLYAHGYLNMSRENGVHYFHELVRAATAEQATAISLKEVAG